MKYLFVTRRYPPFAGGAENQMARTAAALAKHGHMVRVFTGRYDKRLPVAEEQNGIMVLRLPDPGIRFIGTLLFLWNLAWQMRHRSYYDAVFTNMINESSAVGMIIGKILHKKVFFRVSCKENLAECGKFSLKRFYQRIAFCADGMIAQTEELKQIAIDKGYDKEKITVIPNIIPPESFSEYQPGKNPLLHILWCGRLHPDKNPVLLCDIAEKLRNKLEFVIDIVGDGSETEKVKTIISSKGLESFFIFHGFQKDTSDFYKNADIYLLTSDTDAMPNTVLEAMAASLPIVATNVNGVPVLVEDGTSALLFPPGNAEAGVIQILRFANDPSLRKTFGKNAQKRAMDLFSENVSAEKYEKLI